MKRFARVAALILVVGASSLLLTASPVVVPSGTWAPTGDLSETRSGAAAVLLSDGVVLVTGGSGTAGPSASTERYGVAGGTFVATAPMLSARANHTATSLNDGRVLIVGGFGSDGAAVAGAEIYDPSTNTWQPAGTLLHARGRHTATPLPDGRVLVAGGENSEGVLATLEIYSPIFEEFLLVATPMTTARTQHAAALVGDRVLITGGRAGAATLASVDVYDSANDSVGAGPSMLEARAEHSATALLDGNVLIAGGTNLVAGDPNVEHELATAEVFDAAAGQFVATHAMGATRRNHLAILLPHNNSVLIAGGSSDGTATATAELYRAWQDGGIFVPTGSSLSARTGSTGSALSFAASSTNRSGPADGLVLVAGGDGASTSELYGFATVKTDKDDYSPGMTVRVSGSGWQPNQPVTLFLRELPAEHYARLFTIEADGSGNIAWTDLFLVEQHHLGVRFLLTAADGVSQAQTTFTDGRTWTLGITPTAVTASTTQFHTLTVTNTSAPPPTGNLEIGCVAVTAHADFTLVGTPTIVAAPDGIGTWTITRVGQVIEARANADSNRLMIGNEFLQFKIEATAPGTANSYAWNGVARNARNCTATQFDPPSGGQPSVSVAPAVAATSVTNVSGTGTYGSAATLTATLKKSSDNSPISGKSISFQVNGNPAGAALTDISGVATLTGVNVTGINAGTHVNAVAASFGGDSGYSASDGAGDLTVNQAEVAIAASSHNVTYGDDAPTVTASYAGFVIGEGQAVLTTLPTCTTTYVDGSPVAGSPYPTTCEGAAADNYTFTYTPGSVTVLAAGVAVTASSHTVTYGDAVPTVTASYSGFVNGETEAVLTTATACATTYVDGSPVAGSPYPTSCEGAAAANYTFTYAPGSVTVLAASVVVTASSHTVTYGDAAPTVTASYAGFVNGETEAVLTTATTCATTYVDGSPVAGSPYPTSCEGAAAVNYTFAYAPGSVTVLAANVVVTASSHTVTYGDAVPTVAASYAGFVNGETEAVLTSVATCTTTYVGGSPVAGSPYSTSCEGAAATNYTFTYTPGSVTVLAATVAVMASSHTVTYGDAPPTVTASYAGFVNGETESVLTTAPTCTTTYLSGSPVAGSPYPTNCTDAAAVNYTFTYAPGGVTVLAATVTVTASSHTVTYGDAVPTVTTSYAGFVNGETEAVLTTVATCTTTYIDGSPVTGSPYPTTCEGAAATNYTFTYAPGSVTVLAASVAVTASSHTVTYGDAVPTVTASYAGFVNEETEAVLTTAPSCTTTYVDGGPVASSPYATSCEGATATNYTFTYTAGSVTVLAASVTVTASSHTVTYGDAVPTVTASYAGFVNDETEGVLTTAPSCTTTYVDGSPVASSPYPSTCAGAAAANYTFTYAPGSVSVVAASVAVTASSHTVTYGDPVPTVTASYAGFVNGETQAVLTSAPTCTTTYVDGSLVAGSPYPSTCAGAAATNYTFSYAPGSVTVIAASVAVTASSHTVTYGEAPPTVTASYAGFVNGETQAVLTTVAACTTTYVDGSPVAGSPYPTTCEGAAAANYTFAYTPGGVAVLPASVTVTASSHTVTYGDVAPAVTASLAGFVNSETAAVLTAAPLCTTVYVAGSPVAGSPYATNCASAAAANYVFGYTPGSVTVNKKALTVTASSHTLTFNDPVPAITPNYSGFVLGENHTALTTQPSCSTSYSVGSLIGMYPSTCNSAASGNYQIGYAAGTVTVLTACSAFNGFLSPVGGAVENGNGGTFEDPVRAFKLNSTIPVKFNATCFGAPLVNGIHTLQATKASNSTSYDTPIDATPTDAATVGNQFRLTGMEWHFNLSTKAGMSQGKWLLKATLFDGSSYSVWVEIKR